MRIVHKDQVKRFENGKNCVAFEYPMDDKDINGAVIELTGRYPETGRTVNLECKELAYVIAGAGKVFVNDEKIDLQKGDLVLIEPGEKFFWDGNMTLFVPCTPAWHHEQYKQVE